MATRTKRKRYRGSSEGSLKYISDVTQEWFPAIFVLNKKEQSFYTGTQI
jgi:hypothetical protein